jgi:hypothetical protein
MSDETLDQISEEETLRRLLAVDEVPKGRARLPRLGITVYMKGLLSKEVNSAREQCTTYREVKRNGRVVERIPEIDNADYSAKLIVMATESPKWGAPELLKKYSASSAEQVVHRLLLAGEIEILSNMVLKLSGFEEGIDEIKN